LDELSKRKNDLIEMPDFSGYVTWDRLEDALKGIRESLEKSTNDAAIALASTRDNRPVVQLVERQSQTVSDQFFFFQLISLSSSQQNEKYVKNNLKII
jgi:hypothetical protein